MTASAFNQGLADVPGSLLTSRRNPRQPHRLFRVKRHQKTLSSLSHSLSSLLLSRNKAAAFAPFSAALGKIIHEQNQGWGKARERGVGRVNLRRVLINS